MVFHEKIIKLIYYVKKNKVLNLLLKEKYIINFDKYDLSRFIEIQRIDNDLVVTELTNGKKVGHYMWYMFPQIQGLDESFESIKYGISSVNEAKAYLKNEKLRNRLINLCEILIKHETNNPGDIFPYIDTLKLKSCMTLFDYVSNNKYDIFKKSIR